MSLSTQPSIADRLLAQHIINVRGYRQNLINF